MNAEIISIGTELLLGEIVDTNSAHIARNLRDIGLNLYFTTTVGDNQARITEAISFALDRADIIITTGGLGPTVDDVTRQSVAAATGRTLEFRQDLFDQIAERFARFGSEMPENNRQQAYIPAGALAIENPVGTAPCFAVESERGVVISLPGVPREMTYLLDTAVLPYLRQKFNLTSVIKARVLRTAGIGESTIDDVITDLMKLINPTVGLAAHTGQTDIRITAKADDIATAELQIAEVEAEIRRRLGDYIYGVDKDRLEAVLVQELQRTGMQIAVIEAGLGNKLHERLLQQEGSATILAHAQQYPDADSLCAALDLALDLPLEELGAAAVQQAQATAGTPLALSVIARSDATVISVLTPDGLKTRTYRFSEREGRPSIWASTWGMALVWRWVHGQPDHAL
jgi:nicotinamide-nucleotide amidase